MYKEKTPIKINQDANIFVTELSPGQRAEYHLADGRQAYLLCIEGDNVVVIGDHQGEQKLSRHDAAEIYGPNKFTIVAPDEVRLSSELPGSLQLPEDRNDKHATTAAHMILVEMEYRGDGRTDL